MKIKLSICMFLLICFFNLGAFSNQPIINADFNNIESLTREVSKFKSNGVKLQYISKNSLKDEKNSLILLFKTKINGNYKNINDNHLEITNEDFNINIVLWTEKEINYVDITIINKNDKYNLMYLEDLVGKLKDKDSKITQYFLYYEGQLEESSKQTIINKNINLKNVSLIKINNGYTGTGELKDKQKVNFALTSYNGGSYIIIGTPIIFVTY